MQFDSVAQASAFFSYSRDQQPLISAHRGGPYPGYPENCIATFDHTLQYTPAIIELDVAMTADSVLVLMHDNSLDRTTTGTGPVLDYTWAQMQNLFLKDQEGQVTSYKIPSFAEALAWAKGKTVLSVDIKRGVPYKKVLEEIQAADMEPNVFIITYSAGQAAAIHRLNPHVLISASVRNMEELQRMEETGIPSDKILAFTGTRRSPQELYTALHQKGIMCIIGTMGNLDRQAVARGGEVYRQLVQSGVQMLSTDRPLEAAEALDIAR